MQIATRIVSDFLTKKSIVNYINISKRWGVGVALVNSTCGTVSWVAHTDTPYESRTLDPITGIAYSYAKGFCYGLTFPITIPLASFRLSVAMAEQDGKWLFPLILPRWSANPKYLFRK